jgi:hypothetical protein
MAYGGASPSGVTISLFSSVAERHLVKVMVESSILLRGAMGVNVPRLANDLCKIVGGVQFSSLPQFGLAVCLLKKLPHALMM